AQSVSLIPEPVKLDMKSGAFRLDAEVEIVAGKTLQQQAAFLSQVIREEANINLPVVKKGSKGKRHIRLEIVAGDAMPSESYTLRIMPQSVVIGATTAQGVFYGIQSLRQLLPDGQLSEIPCLEIEDYPRFAWRGLMLDVSRTFMSVNLVKRYIDLMSLYKLNTLHWHLTDDQGWRIEIKKHPKLTQVGSRFMPEANAMGGYYTQDEIRDVVRYAAERNITIVPEIEMPGHSMAALVACPNLACVGTDKESFTIHLFGQGANIHKEILCAGNEEVYSFMEDVLTEVCRLFPSKYIHIGGDEAPKHFWKTCPRCQKTIADHHLADENALQGYFVERILKILEKQDKTLVGWDEILMESKLPPQVVGMCWRSREYVEKFAVGGHRVVATPTNPLYFDYDYNRNNSKNVYEYDPVVNISAEAGANVLGMQANFWSHIDRSELRIDKQLFPRLLALAGAAWTPPTQKEWTQFRIKLDNHKKRLEKMYVNYYKEEQQ
ncbi:MAG: beta-N-acetylhexosaminidase, partial [Tannerella sp.]|nr:beta-N-acetylhexosaminidase [Tannerella sp.]